MRCSASREAPLRGLTLENPFNPSQVIGGLVGAAVGFLLGFPLLLPIGKRLMRSK